MEIVLIILSRLRHFKYLWCIITAWIHSLRSPLETLWNSKLLVDLKKYFISARLRAVELFIIVIVIDNYLNPILALIGRNAKFIPISGSLCVRNWHPFRAHLVWDKTRACNFFRFVYNKYSTKIPYTPVINPSV